MPSIRLKLKTTVQKWHAMLKRRTHPGDEDGASQDSLGGSQKSKQHRTMTDASMQPTFCTLMLHHD